MNGPDTTDPTATPGGRGCADRGAASPQGWWLHDVTGDTTCAAGPALAPPQHDPEEQSAPGPGGRVPADRVRHLHR